MNDQHEHLTSNVDRLLMTFQDSQREAAKRAEHRATVMRRSLIARSVLEAALVGIVLYLIITLSTTVPRTTLRDFVCGSGAVAAGGIHSTAFQAELHRLHLPPTYCNGFHFPE